MNWKLVMEVGIKIAASLFAGGMVFAGVARGIERSKNQQPQQQPQQPQQQPQQPQYQSNGGYGCQYQPQQPQPQQPQDESVTMSSLKSMTNTCGKLFLISQTVTQLADNVNRLFDDNSSVNVYYGNPYQGNNNNQCCGNGQWNRISPFIVQA